MVFGEVVRAGQPPGSSMALRGASCPRAIENSRTSRWLRANGSIINRPFEEDGLAAGEDRLLPIHVIPGGSVVADVVSVKKSMQRGGECRGRRRNRRRR